MLTFVTMCKRNYETEKNAFISEIKLSPLLPGVIRKHRMDFSPYPLENH